MADSTLDERWKPFRNGSGGAADELRDAGSYIVHMAEAGGTGIGTPEWHLGHSIADIADALDCIADVARRTEPGDAAYRVCVLLDANHALRRVMEQVEVALQKIVQERLEIPHVLD